jgi:outer membrane protein insertion porin family
MYGQERRYAIADIEVHGSKAFSEGDYGKWLSFRAGENVSQSQIADRSRQILTRLREEGRYFASIDSLNYRFSRDSSEVALHLFISEGPDVRVSEITYMGLAVEFSSVLNRTRLEAGDAFVEADLEEDFSEIVSYLERRGYPYCRVEVDTLQMVILGEDIVGVVVVASVDVGPPVSVSEIQIRGNRQTRSRVILRELRIPAGAEYDQRVVDAIVPRLMRMGFFKWVNPPRLEWLPDSTGRLVIELEESSSNQFDGILGYNPGATGEKGFITGMINLSFRSLFGTGRRLDTRWERRAAETQEFVFRYIEPWVMGFPVNLDFGFEQLLQDTSYVQRSTGLGTEFLYSDKLSFFSRVSTRTISPDSLAGIRFGIPKSRALNLSLGVTFSTVDLPANPSGGLYYSTSFEWSRKRVAATESSGAPDETFDQKRLSVDFESYTPLFRWQILALGLHGREITSDEPVVPITEQYRFGGSRSLRGYREEQFRGSRIAWASFEYRYLLGRFSRFFGFVDVGYFFREEMLQDAKAQIKETRLGYGIGLRIDTRLGIFGIDYGLGEGDGLSDGKVHVGLSNVF